MYDATPAVALLERAIGYTRGTLAGVRTDLLCQPTPCARWRLGVLLDHMADSLDALTEASTGLVPLTPAPALPGDRVETIKAKACTLLGAWTSPAARTVLVCDRDLDARLVLGTGALEIVLHGWDVAQATGAEIPIPDDLASALLPVAGSVVGEPDRGSRFAEVVTVADDAPAEARLLGFCGRKPLQHHGSHR